MVYVFSFVEPDNTVTITAPPTGQSRPYTRPMEDETKFGQ